MSRGWRFDRPPDTTDEPPWRNTVRTERSNYAALGHPLSLGRERSRHLGGACGAQRIARFRQPPRTLVRGCRVLDGTDAMNPEKRPLVLQRPRPADAAMRHHEHRVERLIDRLPDRLRTITRWLRRPSSRWLRVPTGLLLMGSSLLSILPLFGIWMLPLGLMLLAEDVPPLRQARDRLLEWIERHRPNWFTTNEQAGTTQISPPSSPPCGRASSRRTL